MIRSHVLAVLRRSMLVVAAAAAALASAHCSSTAGTGRVSACDTVCNCVEGKSGDRAECMRQCDDVATRATNPKSECETRLAANGYASCSSTCASFTTGGASDTSAAATLADFCRKCASCVEEPGFQEGFCTPFVGPNGFDADACTQRGDVRQLKSPSMTVGRLASLSCAAFDEAE